LSAPHTLEGSMRLRRLVVVVGVLGVLMLGVAPALAGGSWITPGRSAYEPADVAVIRGTFGSGAYEGRLDDGPFIAYLLPATRWINDGRVPAAAIPIGELTITGTCCTFHARVEFRVPDLPTGMYHVQYCNEPCTVDGIGDLIGSESFAIGATRTEARLLIQTQRLRWKIDEVAYRARQAASAEIRDVKLQLRLVRGQLTITEGQVEELTEALGATRRALKTERTAVGAAWVLPGGLLLAVIVLLIGLAVTTKRLRAARLDAELQALTHEPTHAER